MSLWFVFCISDWFGYDISKTSWKDWFKKKEDIYQKLMMIPGLDTYTFVYLSNKKLIFLTTNINWIKLKKSHRSFSKDIISSYVAVECVRSYYIIILFLESKFQDLIFIFFLICSNILWFNFFFIIIYYYNIILIFYICTKIVFMWSQKFVNYPFSKFLYLIDLIIVFYQTYVFACSNSFICVQFIMLQNKCWLVTLKNQWCLRSLVKNKKKIIINAISIIENIIVCLVILSKTIIFHHYPIFFLLNTTGFTHNLNKMTFLYNIINYLK